MRLARLFFVGLASLGAAFAQSWPTQPIRLLVPYPPAGATDVVAREMADKLGTANGWTFIVENKPGAGGNIGIDALVKSRPDGHTLAIGQTANLAINPSLYRHVPYDSLRDVTPIAFITQQPVVVVVKADAPFKNLADLVRAGKSGRALSMASAATGTVGHLAGEMLARQAGFNMTHIPYKGAGAALTDLIGGQTEFMLPTPQAALQLIHAGKLRALAVTSARRLPVLPDVPTVAESGYAGFEAVDWKVLIGPARMPPAVVSRLHDEVERALARPEMQSRLQGEGSVPVTGTQAQLAAFIRAEHARWGAVVKAVGVTAD
jgi:tripartite-type tricarboxylate transporter receptor subunit TctC